MVSVINLLLAAVALFLLHDLAVRLFKNYSKPTYYPLITLIVDLLLLLIVFFQQPTNELLLLMGLAAWLHFIIYSVIANWFPNDRFPSTNDYWLTIPAALLLFVTTNAYFIPLIQQLFV